MPPERPASSAWNDASRALAALREQMPLGNVTMRHQLTLASNALEALMLERTSAESKISGLSAQVTREQKKADTLSRASQMVTSSLDLDTVLRSVLDLAVEVMNAERGFLMLTDPSGTKRHVAVMHNFDRPSLDENDQKISQSIVERVFSSGEAIITTDAQSDPRFSSQTSIMALHIRSIVCVPLKIKERTIGVAYLDSRVLPGLFSRQDPELLLSFANQAALAIENARLFNDQVVQLRAISSLQQFQKRILESIASGVITLDAERKVTTFNQAAETTFGVEATEMVGHSAEGLNAFVPGFTDIVADFVTQGAPTVTYEIGGMHRRFGALTLEIRLATLAPAGDEAGGIAVLLTDLTAQRTLQLAHAAEIERSRQIEASFERYLAPHVVRSLVRDPASVQLGGERSMATVMFADIRGFTELASKMQAEEVVEMLNAYLKEAVAVVFAHDGLLDKFYGDGMMAVFGPPRVRSDDAERAVRTALRLNEVVQTLQHKFEIGVGLATGEVVAGHIGSARRMDYTVIGDAVNLASRLQGAAPPNSIFCDEATYQASGLRLPAEIMSAKIKGREDLVTVYALKT